jgi:hypothetical protein
VYLIQEKSLLASVSSESSLQNKSNFHCYGIDVGSWSEQIDAYYA